MDTVYLPAHLIVPFFQGRPIRYRYGQGEERTGTLHIDVFQDGLCSIQLQGVCSAFGAVQNDVRTLNASMLDRIQWDGAKREFVGFFEV
ncbi:hypothetical protein SAMN02745166_03088 [Prosthecobacter debontii]|uniref:Uncharacterized protein n=1 Tax=Prosthecobacter debontii TaxID=48467 RepID=A0A1T4YG34_9BACT|nr:hypothetical protein SAMN02745166_03088 [Prosthecobacter debontii]